ncbi:MAG: serine/threonine protein kinase, partial [Acidobacteriaceae bacterium]|nr:serine/threonine protein kinase [Acidobacteriaceae bacterium]
MSEDRKTLLLRSVSEIDSSGEQQEFLRAVCPDDLTLLNTLIDTLTQAAPTTRPGTADWPHFHTGQLLSERFEIRGALGAGGMGLVYEAFDRKIGERRALKFARPGHFQHIPEEARAALRITHENICRIYEIHSASTHEGAADFISMELVEGETLYARIARGPLSRPEILDLARQLCRGIDAAHRANILHLDLKTANLMLAQRTDGSTRLVIMDFGLALSMAEAVQTDHKVAGTPHYIAPERFCGAKPAPPADVYAMGVILYEMLTGERPFSSRTPWSQRITQLPERPSRLARVPDVHWDAIVLRCLQPDPAQRMQSAGEVLAAIEKTFGGNTRRWWITAAFVAALAAPFIAFRDRIWPAPVGRLAVLPLHGTSGSQAVDREVRGAFYDLNKRLASARRLVVIPFEDTTRNSVDSAKSAASRLGATHVLNVNL